MSNEKTKTKEQELKEALKVQEATQKFIDQYQKLCKKHNRTVIGRLQKVEDDVQFGFRVALAVGLREETPEDKPKVDKPKEVKKKVEKPE